MKLAEDMWAKGLLDELSKVLGDAQMESFGFNKENVKQIITARWKWNNQTLEIKIESTGHIIPRQPMK